MENEPFDPSIFGTSRSFKEQLNDPKNPNVYCLFMMDGKEFLLKNSYNTELHQKTADHDTFSITVPDDALDSFKGYVLENSKNILGNDITINFWQWGKIQQSFSGIIGGIDNAKNEGGGYGDLIITGFSPSILLESGKDCQSFEDKTLEQIIGEVCETYPREARVKVDLPNVKYALPYTVQYKESDYQFIRRLAVRHGEFFYYNGEELIFGAGTQPTLKLREGNELIDVTFSLKIGAQDFGLMSYDAGSGSKVEKDGTSQQSEFKANLFQSVAINRSKNLFRKKPKMHFNHTGISDMSEKELQEALRLEKEKKENLMQVKARSYNPAVRIGGRVELSDINGKAMETYRIIEIKHIHDPGEYYNEFTAIPDLFNAAPYIDTEAVPKGEEQPARVVENNDPMGMGRIRVQFPWQEDKGQRTPWVRLIQPHSGAGKGFHFIPEIGEEVLVSHESQNAEKPFVMGTHYNGSETSSYHTSGNDKKVIHTRSGTKIILNDAEGSVFIEDPSGNTYLMDGAGNINVNAPKNMTFTAGENVTITAGMNITASAGMNISETAGMNHSSFAGAMMMQNAVADYSLMAANIMEVAQGERKSKAQKVTDQSKEKKIISENKNEIHTKGTFDNNGGENSNLH
ncbi:type VI secretion system Vgr family protein [Chryseobacterium shigense]|uniref:Rhs element Vgr protein n=1 Tax=Chryseobacterium shigense TaxID=297244 RepID=A0A841N5R3_9FLAO|nr:phage baseplate assembly protein V [Chryseobacterium shigense]MBB6370061.1 Rhs element Vgr protein [Chryseobacterium shigense]